MTPGVEPPQRQRPSFFGSHRRAQIILSIVTLGAWLWVLLIVWLWRSGYRRPSYVLGGVTALVVIGVAVGSSKSTKPDGSTTGKTTAAGNSVQVRAGDRRAQALLLRSLKDVADNYQVFGDYEVTAGTLKNVDHALRAASGLQAAGSKQTFFVSVTSPSGTRFKVNGVGARLRLTCAPAGPNCPNGQWVGPTRLKFPKVPVLTRAQKNAVRRTLLASIGHYEALLKSGEAAVGKQQYPNAAAGLAAFSDPNSSASRFSHWRTTKKAQSDLSFLAAFKRADNYYTAENEPKSISTWRDDMDAATSALYTWVDTAEHWQISNASSVQLATAGQRIETALQRARHDVELTYRGH